MRLKCIYKHDPVMPSTYFKARSAYLNILYMQFSFYFQVSGQPNRVSGPTEKGNCWQTNVHYLQGAADIYGRGRVLDRRDGQSTTCITFCSEEKVEVITLRL